MLQTKHSRRNDYFRRMIICLMSFSMRNFEFIIFIIILLRRQTTRETDLLVLGYMLVVYIFI